MRILHLEDDESWFNRAAKPALLEAIPNAEICHSPNKRHALDSLDSDSFDVALLDLSVPESFDSDEADISHGIAVAWHIRKSFPGTPIYILTGQSTDEAAERFEEENTFTTFWDGEEKPLVRIRKKRHLPKLVNEIKALSESLKTLDEVELDYDKRKLTLEKFDKRVLRLFGAKNNAVVVTISPLSDGLSSAKVLKLQLLNNLGNPLLDALVKLDLHDKVDAEKVNFSEYVTRLPVGSFPTYLDEFYACCGQRKGVFFQFASDFSLDYFDLLLDCDVSTSNIVECVKVITDNWTQAKRAEKLQVRDIRRNLCSDNKFEKKNINALLESAGIDFSSIENRVVRSNFSIQHADLHGMNILLTDDHKPIIIDYGDIKDCSSVTDPITLELSQYFHPKTASKIERNLALATHWFDDDFVSENSLNPKTANKLRNWSREVSLSRADYTAGVYAYALRQLAYDDTDKAFALELARSSVAELTD